MRPLTCREASGELSAALAGGWIAQRVPLAMAADVALVVPVLAIQEIHRSPRTPGIASGSDGGLPCELPLPTASLLAPDRLLQARPRTFRERPTLLARLDVRAVDVLKCNPGSVEWGHIMDVEFDRTFAQRARDLADKADPFTRKRLLVLAEKYDAKLGKPSPASRNVQRTLPLPRTVPAVSAISDAGEA